MRQWVRAFAFAFMTAAEFFFFLVPIVGENIEPCSAQGHGYASLSYRFLHVGEVFLGRELLLDLLEAFLRL